MSGWSNVISPTVTVGASSSICYGDDTNAPSVQWSQHAPSDMLKGGRSFDRPRPQRDHPNSLCVIRFHFIHEPTDYSLRYIISIPPSYLTLSLTHLIPTSHSIPCSLSPGLGIG